MTHTQITHTHIYTYAYMHTHTYIHTYIHQGGNVSVRFLWTRNIAIQATVSVQESDTFDDCLKHLAETLQTKYKVS